jgi:hypothetical protein
MYQHIKRRTLILILPLACSLAFIQTVLPQTPGHEDQALKHYDPKSWPRTSDLLVPGLKLDDFEFEGFQVTERQYFAPARGVRYTWQNKREQLEVRIVVSVHASAEAAHRALLDWLVNGTSTVMQRGALTDPDRQIGDISWVDRDYGTLAFARGNVVIIMFGDPKAKGRHQLVDRMASTIDEELNREPLVKIAPGDFEKMAPSIERVALEDAKLRVNDLAKLTVVANDPLGRKLEYGYYATGGNILRMKDGVFYQATTPGDHTITVTVVSPENIVSERAIRVSVCRPPDKAD